MKEIYKVKTRKPQTSSFSSKVERFTTAPSLSKTTYYTAHEISNNQNRYPFKKSSTMMNEIQETNNIKKQAINEKQRDFVRIILTNPKNT